MKDLKKLFTKDNLIILVLAGVLLIVITLPVGKDTNGTGNSASQLTESQSTEVTDSMEIAQYREDLEQQLEAILSSVKGVGKVKVMITLKTSKETVVEKETPVQSSVTEEKDSQGNLRSVVNKEYDEKVVQSTNGNEKIPFVKKTVMPEIEGVMVVAQGAGTGKVNQTVSSCVQALFGLEPHKIMVVGMRTE